MEIVFTRHAEGKFKVLERHGFIISKHSVLVTVTCPEVIDYSRRPLRIAQRQIDKAHVLRVVYKHELELIKIITFYPARAKQYL